MSKISIQYSTTFNNQDVKLFRIENNKGAYIEITNFGATLVSVVIPNKRGELQNMILSYQSLESYFTDEYYIGSTVGRIANRISGAKFKIGDTIYYLDKNDGENSNHGGFNGLNKKVFDFEVLQDKVIFRTISKNNEGGFPGNLEVNVSYSLSDENNVEIIFDTTSDELTPINLTNHAYFNLSGGNSDATDHFLNVFSKEFLEFDEDFLPTGKFLEIEKSPSFNFIHFRKIHDNMLLKNEKNIKGFNTYFIADNESKTDLKLISELKDNLSTVLLKVRSTMPGIQFYTGDYLSKEFLPFSGVCMEAQYYPDFVNKSAFPSSFINKGETWKEKIVYDFTIL